MENGRDLLEMVCKAYVSPDPVDPSSKDMEDDSFDFGKVSTTRSSLDLLPHVFKSCAAAAAMYLAEHVDLFQHMLTFEDL